jgi:predicted O-methyltransferase YrrM
MSPAFAPEFTALVDRLEARSKSQVGELNRYFGERARAGDIDWNHFDARSHKFLADKLVALEPEKSNFCYAVCRALQAKRVVEIGTSYGVSTLYLAAAVRDGGGGLVIATEYESAKAAAARAHFAEAKLSDYYIDLREGDLRETLKQLEGPIDFVLMDIWTEMARPAIELVAPHLRPGAVVVCDNTGQFADAYGDYFAYLNDPSNRFTTQTLPFEGGLEFSVRL